MRIQKFPIVLFLVAAISAAIVWQPATQAPQDAGSNTPSGAKESGQVPGTNSLSAPSKTGTGADNQLTSEQQAMLEAPRVIEFAQRLDFQSEVRGFFANAPDLPADEASRRATAIQNQLDGYENTGEVSAPEALMVRLAMVQLLEPNEAAAKAAATALITKYRSASEARLAEWKSSPEPEFRSYKAREKAIAAEVMSMERFPNGLTRDQYLRQRLQQARIETMGQDAQN